MARVEVNISLAFLYWVGIALQPGPFFSDIATFVLKRDFKLQLTDLSCVYRLSERNCVEIVQRLVELKLLEVIHTTDGKEYLTPNELGKEIREELVVRGGNVDCYMQLASWY